MSAEFANYVPVQDIQGGGDSGIIEITQSVSESVAFPDAEELIETITETVTVNVT